MASALHTQRRGDILGAAHGEPLSSPGVPVAEEEADEFTGAWAEGDDEAAALDELVSVIFDWAVLEMDKGDNDLQFCPG